MGPDDAQAVGQRRRFLRRPQEVAAARRFVGDALAGAADDRETVRLLVSEAVTSVLDQPGGQADGSFEVGWALRGDRLHVEVSDDGGPARLRRRIHEVGAPGGWGLQLVQALASRWGVREDPGGRAIWFDLDLRGQPSRAT
ncbi:MAG TPA: ATP-binding protein [Actinomycetes bacterium]|jgi:hypothetical protein|nr:ATP-binding protein [Actinomycetes bacterium]